MNVREKISRLETLLQRIQSHSRARRSEALGERRVVLESYTSEAATTTLEEVESAPPEALDESDVVEMSSDVLESVPPPPVVSSAPPSVEPAASAPQVFAREEIAAEDLDFEEEEEAPASSKRHRISGTIDDAVSAAAREPVLLEEGREVPLKTPPPESGPQEAPPPPGSLAPPKTPDLDDLLDDLPPAEHVAAAGPRPEQLGETIELNEPLGPPLEIDQSRSFTQAAAPEAPEELEVTLPFGKYAGNYDESLMPPPEARQDLLDHRRKSGQVVTPEHEPIAEEPFASIPPVPEVTLQPAPIEVHTVPAAPAAETAMARNEPSHVAVRGSLSGLSAAEFTAPKAVPQLPKTFVELLDESIRLGGN